MDDLRNNPNVRPCCREPENLRVIESKATMTVRRCDKCGAKHYDITLEPGHIQMREGGPR